MYIKSHNINCVDVHRCSCMDMDDDDMMMSHICSIWICNNGVATAQSFREA